MNVQAIAFVFSVGIIRADCYSLCVYIIGLDRLCLFLHIYFECVTTIFR